MNQIVTKFNNFFLTENNILFAIAINAIVIFFLGFPEWQHNTWLNSLDIFFILLFLVEAIVKLNHYGVKGYFEDRWNIFDFIVVVGSLPQIIIFDHPEAQSFGLILLLRLFRLFRLVKFFWFNPNLSHLLNGLFRAFRASIFVLIMLLFFNFILSILTTHLYGHIVPDHFGDPLKSIYTIFQLFTIEGWNEIPSDIVQHSDNEWDLHFVRFYFAAIVLFGGIFGMSLANAIFVDEMTIDNNEAVEQKLDELEKQIQEIKALLVAAQSKSTPSPTSIDKTDVDDTVD